MDPEQVEAALVSVRRLLELVEVGDVECDVEQLLRLEGAEATFVALLAAQV